MGMPQIPENKHRPDLNCTIIDLMESIALEEISLSHLLNAEAEKIQAFVGEKLEFPFCTRVKEVIDFSKLTNDFMEKIIMKQWLLLNKLNKITEMNHHLYNEEKQPRHSQCGDCTRPLKKFCD